MPAADSTDAGGTSIGTIEPAGEDQPKGLTVFEAYLFVRVMLCIPSGILPGKVGPVPDRLRPATGEPHLHTKTDITRGMVVGAGVVPKSRLGEIHEARRDIRYGSLAIS